MPAFRNFNAPHTARLRNQVSAFPRLPPDKSLPIFAEHFENWTLAAPERLAGMRRMRDAAVNTGWVHHQLSRNGKTRQFARSTSIDTSCLHDIQALVRSPLARKIDVAFKWLNKQVIPRESTVRLLFVPLDKSIHLWLVTGQADYFVLADGPRHPGQCAYRHLYDFQTFRDKLLALAQSRHAEAPASGARQIVEIAAASLVEPSAG